MKSTPNGKDQPDTAGLSGEVPAHADANGRHSTVRTLRRLLVLLLALGLVATGFFAGGFLKYADDVTALRIPSPLVADGIVVLTGGAERISGAVELLAAGRARRLLISGVNPGSTPGQIARSVDATPELMACCIDLDRRAANTIGNAIETAKWARTNGFLSLIVVTSAYHMPRSMLELRHAMPDIRLIPFPVTRTTLELDHWQRNWPTLSLMVQEYTKYLATRLRLQLSGVRGLSDILAGIAR